MQASSPDPRAPLGEPPAAGRFYGRFAPGRELSWAVESFWVQEHPETPETSPTTVLPAGRAELIVHYGDPFQHLTPDGARTLPAVAVLGQRTRLLKVRATGATGLVIVCLHPWATSALLGDASSELTDELTPVEDIAGRPLAERLRARVAEQSDPASRIEAVQHELAPLLRRAPDLLAVETVSQSVRSWGSASVAEISRHLGVSRRTLARRVLRATGVGPKRLLSLSRYQKALAALRSGLGWSEVVARCGYYDQSHLIRELRSYTGSTPNQLARTGTASALAATFNSRDLSHFSNTVYL